ncbi:MAG: transcriptional regulator NrdR [Fibrobacterota bacterium]
MKCPYCTCNEDKVVDSRSSKEGRAIRRRRECIGCGKRYTTYEYIENVALMVVKNDNRREPFDRQKLFQGIATACKKRPVKTKKIEAVIDKIEEELQNLSNTEVQSKYIGELIMRELHDLDEVAYVRFASVYRHFKDTTEFMQELQDLALEKRADFKKS